MRPPTFFSPKHTLIRMWNSTVFVSDRLLQLLRDTFVYMYHWETPRSMGRKNNLANKTTTMSTDCETPPALFTQRPNPGDRSPPCWDTWGWVGWRCCCGADSAGFLIKSKNINCLLCYQSGRCYQVWEWSGWRSIRKPGMVIVGFLLIS